MDDEARRAANRAKSKRWREQHREEFLKAHAADMRRYRATGRIHDQEWRKAWRAAHPETVRESARKSSKKYAAANPDKERERRERFRAEHPTYWTDRRDKGREYERDYRERHPERRPWHKRRAAKAGIPLIVRVDTSECGVCLDPLLPAVTYPSPLATTIGHEPPLMVAERDGWAIIVERQEHLRCNLWKGTRMDSELRGHAAVS